MAEKFSLKDFLFNQTKITQLANEIKMQYPAFKKEHFITEVISKFPELELKQRISWIRECLRKYLPHDYQEAVHVILRCLPKPNDPTLTDNDFGEFIYAPYAEFVAIYGCNKENLAFSLHALKEITQRVSVEDAIRYFINAFPDQTMKELLKWSKDTHYHVRRLSSEGTRPKLPWSQKINIPVEAPLPILDNLYYDPTRYVTRSVANHLNDISKSNPDIVLQTLKKWEDSGKQNQDEMNFIINHSLRTLIKQGYSPAFTFLNYSNKAAVELSDFTIKNTIVKIGTSLEFSFAVHALKNENLLVDYILSFQNKKGEMNSKKVFKLKKVTMNKNETMHFKKLHPMREQMTTRTLYPGEHKLEIQINGTIQASQIFEVVI